MSRRLPHFVAAVLAMGLGLAQGAELPPDVANAMREGYQSTDPQVLARAADRMEAHLKSEPGHGELERALAILYLDRLKVPDKALPHLQHIAEEAPNDSAWQQSLARALRATGRNEEAAEHFRRAAELQPGDAWARYELGNTLAGANRYEPAIAAYRAAIELDPKNTAARLALARTLWADGQIEEARLAARTVLDYEPLNSGARKLLLAEFRPTNPAPAPSSSAVATPTPLPPKPPAKQLAPVDAAVAEAYASGSKQQFERAARLLEQSLQRDPRNLSRRKMLGFFYLKKLGAPRQAIPHLELVAERTPKDAAWLQMLADAQTEAGDREAAASTLRSVADVSPRDVWARYHLGCALRDLGRTKEAESAFREALEMDGRNPYVRRELARLAKSYGRRKEATAVAQELVHEDARDAEAHALLGDIYRENDDFDAARTEYEAALAINPTFPQAATGVDALHKAQCPTAKAAFYTFDDTDGLRQTGVFTHVGFFVTGRLQAFVSVNERFFKRSPDETSERFEGNVGFDYRFGGLAQVVAGVSQFKTSNLHRETGANIALYLSPAESVDAWITYRYADPVNDSYVTASQAFTQDILGTGITLRPIRNFAVSVSATTAEYSDGNMRRSALASVAWYAPLPASPVVRLEYEWLDFDERTPAYSSPQNYGRFRPVLEIAPRLTDWLKLEFHGELSYVFDERDWGTGFTIGPRFNAGDTFDLGLSYMKYEIPGGQTTWSGEGFKADLSLRF
jgi:tetratricopeptide (TPR) repeat protein